MRKSSPARAAEPMRLQEAKRSFSHENLSQLLTAELRSLGCPGPHRAWLDDAAPCSPQKKQNRGTSHNRSLSTLANLMFSFKIFQITTEGGVETFKKLTTFHKEWLNHIIFRERPTTALGGVQFVPAKLGEKPAARASSPA